MKRDEQEIFLEKQSYRGPLLWIFVVFLELFGWYFWGIYATNGLILGEFL